jgi:hypothetical protein
VLSPSQTGINIDIADLFTESTICGIASMIEEKGIKREPTDLGNGTNAKTDESTSTLFTERMYKQDAEYQKARRSRSQNHPLCLIVQAIPFMFFYPSKWCLICK